MRLKEKKKLQKFAAILKKFSAQGAKKVDYGIIKSVLVLNGNISQNMVLRLISLLRLFNILCILFTHSVV